MGEWKTTCLGKLFSRVARKNSENNTNVLTASANYGLISQQDFFKKIVASKDLSNYYLLYNGEFVYNKSYCEGYPMGAFKRLDMYEKGVVTTLYVCFGVASEQVCSDFYLHLFESGLLNDEINTIAQEGARNHGLLNVAVDKFFNIRVPFPDLPEQRRIAAVLTAADEAIATSRALVDKYTSVKQGLVHDLLGKGERVRLDSGIVQINPYCKERRPELFYYIDLEAIIAGEIIKDVIVSRKEAPSRAQRLLKPNDILFQTVRPYQQNNYLFRKERELKTVASTGYAQIRTDNNPVYMYYALHQNDFIREVNNRSTGSNYPAINPTELGKCSIHFEPDRAKQDEIAEILTAADERLTAERERLSKLQNIKRGLMDDLLTNRVSTDILERGREYA